MPKLPHLKWKPAPPGRAERLKRWLDEWQLDQALRQSDPTYAARPDISVEENLVDFTFSQAVAPFDSDPRPGDVRLISPRLFPTFDRPFYVAVLARKAGWFIVAPFGPFLEPATKTEWATGRSETALRVLCLWNARMLPAETVAQSWVVDTLSEPEKKAAWAVFQHASRGIALPDELLPAVGCAVTHPRDPRLQYQAEELELFRAISSTNKGVLEDSQRTEVFAFAAAALPDVTVKRFSVGGRAVHLTVYFEREPSRRFLVVWDNPPQSKPSETLDGCRLFVRTKSAETLIDAGVIQAGHAELPADSIELRLSASDGVELQLEEIE